MTPSKAPILKLCSHFRQLFRKLHLYLYSLFLFFLQLYWLLVHTLVQTGPAEAGWPGWPRPPQYFEKIRNFRCKPMKIVHLGSPATPCFELGHPKNVDCAPALWQTQKECRIRKNPPDSWWAPTMTSTTWTIFVFKSITFEENTDERRSKKLLVCSGYDSVNHNYICW